MKKAVFTYMNYLLPMKGILSMHCSATTDRQTGRSSVLFGLSGTGKTTLSADPKRMLIGDDEHGWSDEGIFNIEGGCYAKAVYLTRESEPEIFDALRFGAVLENVVYDKSYHHVDFNDTSITQNTRGAYPIEHMRNARIPCVASHPSDVIFLTCDAFGVFPPVSRLTREQAMYYFISGYTAKVAGTEVGVSEPEATFSPCFGDHFWSFIHPAMLDCWRKRSRGMMPLSGSSIQAGQGVLTGPAVACLCGLPAPSSMEFIRENCGNRPWSETRFWAWTWLHSVPVFRQRCCSRGVHGGMQAPTKRLRRRLRPCFERTSPNMQIRWIRRSLHPDRRVNWNQNSADQSL